MVTRVTYLNQKLTFVIPLPPFDFSIFKSIHLLTPTGLESVDAYTHRKSQLYDFKMLQIALLYSPLHKYRLKFIYST